MSTNKVLDALMGVCVGDALGVPVEFQPRSLLRQQPVRDMIGYGTHHQPPGTWSDDTSLTLCLAESLCHGYDLYDIGQKFVQWYEQNLWTPHGRVFDVGVTTQKAIRRLRAGKVPPQEAGGRDEGSNGNGSLMRILPIAFYVRSLPPEQRFRIVAEVSALTHGHRRAILSCCAYIELALHLLAGQPAEVAYRQMQHTMQTHFAHEDELPMLSRVITQDISRLPEGEIRSSGYVVHTLEAALWCFLTSHSYAETVLKAVNLGEDTDTTGAVAGGLAGIYYGVEDIPAHWVAQIARREEIIALAERLQRALADR
ncbi:MAG: ADP-ribosylglycohydrolase family protein [Nitrospinota bacterium]|nr:MAG: ADP-ribosylglycohydrolase family protein [Nitrospinota bacterium]